MACQQARPFGTCRLFSRRGRASVGGTLQFSLFLLSLSPWASTTLVASCKRLLQVTKTHTHTHTHRNREHKRPTTSGKSTSVRKPSRLVAAEISAPTPNPLGPTPKTNRWSCTRGSLGPGRPRRKASLSAPEGFRNMGPSKRHQDYPPTN